MKVGNKFPSKSRSLLFQLQHLRFFACEKNLTPAGERSGTNDEGRRGCHCFPSKVPDPSQTSRRTLSTSQGRRDACAEELKILFGTDSFSSLLTTMPFLLN